MNGGLTPLPPYVKSPKNQLVSQGGHPLVYYLAGLRQFYVKLFVCLSHLQDATCHIFAHRGGPAEPLMVCPFTHLSISLSPFPPSASIGWVRHNQGPHFVLKI